MFAANVVPKSADGLFAHFFLKSADGLFAHFFLKSADGTADAIHLDCAV